ncbi:MULTISPECIES: SURF1 family cytochrome oxidase biogenesis protein [Actinosynnema]|uniref:SURF1 family cytochrome oxidase biogenesis protein n=1 Tax=Actinosynnema TaxID=40566 RepID=UPI001E359DAE|nr:SURF1 family cytochrome oxidase biogenesis protein [Actinosynnema pretiosum]
MRLRFLLRPGWLALTVAVWVFAGVCIWMLAPWQFGRDDQRVGQNTALSEAMATDPVPFAEVLDEPNAEHEWRRVVLTGQFLADSEAVARLRTVQGEAAYEVLTPFRTTDGPVVLVDRGYVRPADGMGVPDLTTPPSERVSVTAWTRAEEPDLRDGFLEDGERQVYSINTATVGRMVGLDIRPGYFQLDVDQPGLESALPLPRMEAGPFYSYALQWLAFGIMAIGGWLYFTWREAKPGGALTRERERKPRRKSVAELLAEDEAAENGTAEAAEGGEERADAERASGRRENSPA